MFQLDVHLFEKSYSIYVDNSFRKIRELFEEYFGTDTYYIVITDNNVFNYYYDEFKKVLNGERIECFVFDAGEHSKSFETVEKIYDFLIKRSIDKKCVLIALGGGVVGDVTGFVAGTYMCGVRYVQVPTTLLAQVDSSIGGKTGIDGYTLKNIIGIFKQPEFVFINTSTLETLNDRHYRAGITEMLVHGLVGGVEAFDYLQNNMSKILLRDNDAMQEIIVRSCDIKVKLVENDEFENSVRSYLNLGHTIGHAIEGWTNYQILHGEAVSIGIYAIFKFACQKGFIKINDVKIVNDLLMKIGLPICLNTIEPIQIMKRMRYDKKVKNGKIYVIIPTKLGEVCIYPLNANDEDIILQILKSLKQAF